MEVTKRFHFFNANPHGKKTSDCVIRAICSALHEPWETTLQNLTDLSKKTGLMVNDTKLYTKHLEMNGWHKQSQPRHPNGKKLTTWEFAVTVHRAIAHVGGHHTAYFENGELFDTFDCTHKCVGNYWIKNA